LTWSHGLTNIAGVGKRRDSWAGIAICRAAKKRQFPIKTSLRKRPSDPFFGPEIDDLQENELWACWAARFCHYPLLKNRLVLI
jgi:hypothetical protein